MGLLSGKKVLITAGPTYEPIDPVRFIGNHSSGKMGIALSEACSQEGAEVILVKGPVHLMPQTSGIVEIDVTTAEEMLRACMDQLDNVDIVIMAAAIADYTPVSVADQKMKKSDDELVIQLKRTKDVLKEMAKVKGNQKMIGFALETNNELEFAHKKLKEKDLDLIVLNSLKDDGSGFGHETNKVTIIDTNNNSTEFELKTKNEVAIDIVKKIAELYEN